MRPASGRTRWIWRSCLGRGHGALGGEVRPGSGSLALTELDSFVTVEVRNALADSRPAALPPY